MGKVKHMRQKLHVAAKTERASVLQVPENTNTQSLSDVVLPLPSDNLFAGFNIDVDTLKVKLNDDIQSVKSVKSLRPEKNTKHTIMSKKEKQKLRREMLLRKIDTVKQMKKDLKLREKRKKIAIIGDTNHLHDALPSLESLLKNRPNIKQNIVEPKKKKGFEKAKKRKKELVQGVKIYNNVLNNKIFKKNPLEAITQHLQTFVNQEKQKLKKD